VCDADRAATQRLHRASIARWLAGSTANAMAMPRSSNACTRTPFVWVSTSERHGRDDRGNAAVDTDDAAAEAIDEAAAGWKSPAGC
jgi:hypothetical protein